jgi:predicted TIM-barrel fold metal-dependent hydrolase
MMKVIALEEHFATPAIIDAWQSTPVDTRDYAVDMSAGPDTQRRLVDLAEERIGHMDDAGVDVQVLSVTTTGVQNIDTAAAIPLARAANDLMAETIRTHPNRFQGFATLPVGAPAQAAAELERAVRDLGLSGAMVFGRHGETNFDHPDFLPILETAAALRVPLYLHPQSPAPPVRKAYYDGVDHQLATIFATGGIGWHYETGVQALRLILAGVFDRLPDLQLILGHWGEVVLFYLDRIDIMTEPAGLPRKVSDYFISNISVTPGGVFSQRYLRWAIEVLGIDRILFATDYPFQLAADGAARRFLDSAELSEADREKIANGNWTRLCAEIRRA